MNPTNHIQATSLLRKKRFALLLLVLAFGLFLLGSILGHQNPVWYWRALIAFAEAALIGGLADWFAVVALFRHPLGLKIPHTAIVPAKKEQIGNALADFVRDHFLTREQIVEKVRAFGPAAWLARTLSAPANAGHSSALLAAHAPRLIGYLDSDALRGYVRTALMNKGRQLDISTLAGKLITILSNDTQRQQDALNGVLQLLAKELREPALRDVLTQRVRNELGGLIRSLHIDRLIAEPLANKIADGALGQVNDILIQSNHPIRERVVFHLQELAANLKHDPGLRSELEHARDQILASDELAIYSHELWQDLLAWLSNDLTSEHSTILPQIKRAMLEAGMWLSANDDTRHRLDDACLSIVSTLVDEYREVARDYIAERVKLWSAEDLAEQLELGIGSDLQYIRYNGTLIGGLIGLALFGCLEAMRVLMG